MVFSDSCSAGNVRCVWNVVRKENGDACSNAVLDCNRLWDRTGLTVASCSSNTFIFICFGVGACHCLFGRWIRDKIIYWMMLKRRRLNNRSTSRADFFEPQAGCSSNRRMPLSEHSSIVLRHFSCKHPLAKLPHELVAMNILCSYLNLEDMAWFDVAVTNHSLRSYLMQVYAHVVLYRPTILRFDATVRWMRMRGIRGRHFELWHGIGKSTLSSFFKTQCAMPNGAAFQTLNLTGYDYLTDAMLTKLAQGSPYMTFLNLAYCSDITDAGVAALASNCGKLETLVLWGCYQLSNDAITLLATHCPRLSSLNLRCCKKIDDTGLAILAAGFRTMHSLNFTYCRNITDVGVRSLARAYPTLRRVSFAYCMLVTDVAVLHLSRHCPIIESLDLTNCNISNEALIQISHSPMATTLRELFISTCRNVTDAGIAQLGNRCRQLASFHVAGCDQITMVGLRALPATCVVHNPA